MDTFAPSILFYGDTEGVWYDASNYQAVLTNLRNANNPQPVQEADDPVTQLRDLSGNGHDAIQNNINRAIGWQQDLPANGGLTDAVLFTPSEVTDAPTGSQSRFPIPNLPARDYNIFMTVQAGPEFTSADHFHGGFASDLTSGSGNDGYGTMLLLRPSGTYTTEWGTWDGGSYDLSGYSISDGRWQLVAMHNHMFRSNGSGESHLSFTRTLGQVAGLGGIGGQLGSFYMVDAVAIARTLTAFELTLLEQYMMAKVRITV